MLDFLLQEPIANLIQQWPFVAVLLVILWFMRRDLLACMEKYDAVVRQLILMDRIGDNANKSTKNYVNLSKRLTGDKA